MKNSEANHFGLSFLLAFFKVGVVIGAAGVLLGFLGRQHWLMDLMAQLRIQWAFGLGALFILLALFRQTKWALTCLIFLSLNTVPIWPYMMGMLQTSNMNVIKTETTRLMSFNVLTHNQKKAEAISAITAKSPDIVLLMEVDAKWENAIRAGLENDYPYIVFKSREDNFGIALLSKTPWDQIEIFASNPQSLPSIEVTFKNQNNSLLRIIGTHPLPPLGHHNWKARNVHLMEAAKRIKGGDSAIMIGDFNVTPWSPIFKDVVTASGLKDSGASFGMTPTWDVFPSLLGALKIDHALVSEDIRVTALEVQKIDGSDHRALVLDIQY